MVLLDGSPVRLPPQRTSLAGICCYLETLAMERQRILCSVTVNGKPLDLSGAPAADVPVGHVMAVSIDLGEMPLQLVRTARIQAAHARASVLAAVPLVLINDGPQSRELWWNLAFEIKQPLVTLSLMPETSCGARTDRQVPLLQFRRWEIEQLAALIKEVDETCATEDPTALSNALETRVAPWVERFQLTLELWYDTLLLGREAAGEMR